MHYLDKDFTPDALCKEVEELFAVSLLYQEHEDDTITFSTADGSPLPTEIANYIGITYGDNNWFRQLFQRIY